MTKKVTIYTTSVCPYCIALKKFFKDYNVEYEEIDASSDEEIQDMLVEKTGKMSVPVVVVDGKWAQGFHREELLELLELK
jgi:glutaredoxin-like YruB-family protein